MPENFMSYTDRDGETFRVYREREGGADMVVLTVDGNDGQTRAIVIYHDDVAAIVALLQGATGLPEVGAV
jgi:hypothetical protein